MSLFTEPDMNPNIGWNATSRPPAAANAGWRGSSSRRVRNANAAVRAPSSADTRRMAVSSLQIDEPCVA
jgi:hypothetical protein